MGVLALAGLGTAAFAWAGGVGPLVTLSDVRGVSAWTDLLSDVPVAQRGWLLLPTGLLAMIFTARRTRRYDRDVA